MRNSNKIVTAAFAALAVGAFLGAAPSLFARGDSGRSGGGGGGGDSGGSSGGGDAKRGDRKGGDGEGERGEARRDGEEQREIGRDAMNRRAHRDFRDFRDGRNRDAGEPR